MAKNALKTLLLLVIPGVLFCLCASVMGQERADTRASLLQDADSFQLRLPESRTLEEWEARREQVRKKVLLTTGLWPPLEKTPLNARVFDEKTGDGFRVAKVYFESLPGFYATGNLYRPAEGSGPFPAVLTPHGHWKFGRLQNDPDGSIPGRCIDLARMGFVVFSPDMVGYNDSFQLPHDHNKSRAQLSADRPVPYEHRIFRGTFDFPEAELYGLNLPGLQLWNSIRGLDFLTSLPEVDPERIGVTGASGGATQTILLMAADDRVKVAAPVNIIGATKHPGCGCENPPGLWVETSTLEVAATFAPKPLLLISATEDPWTHSTPTRELPLFKHYYSLFDASDRVANHHVNAGHNYNAASRAAVYQWFSKHLLGKDASITEPEPVVKDLASLGDLRVFPDHMLPEAAVQGIGVIQNWIQASEASLEAALPRSNEDLKGFVEQFREALRLVLSLTLPEPDELEYSVESEEAFGEFNYRVEMIGRKGAGDWIELESAGKADAQAGLILVAYRDQGGRLIGPDGVPAHSWMPSLLSRGYQLLHPKGYAAGKLTVPRREWDSYSWSSAYNRSDLQNAIQDILTALSSAEEAYPDKPITVIGVGEKGLPAAVAAALYGKAQSVVVDLDEGDVSYDRELLDLMRIGSIRRVGDFRTVALLLLNHNLTLFNAGAGLDPSWLQERARQLGLEGNLNLRLTEKQISFDSLVAR